MESRLELVTEALDALAKRYDVAFHLRGGLNHRSVGTGCQCIGEEGSVDGEGQSPECCPQCEESIRRCRRLLVHLEKGIILPEEFTYNTAVSLLQACAVCMRAYLNSLPDAIAVRFERQLRSLIESEGYMPFGRPFVVDFGSEQELSLKRQTIEPKVVQLCRTSQARASRVRAPRKP